MSKQQQDNPSRSTGSIASSAGTVGGAVMCSRILGLVREQLFAGMFGAGLACDAFVVAFRIPNLLRDLFGEGALSAAFVTVFSDYDTNKGAKATWELASNVLVFFAIFLSFLTLLGIYCAEPVVHLLAPDFVNIPGKTVLTAKLTRIMSPFLLFVSLAAVVMGILNTKGKFFIPALASSFFNLGSIVGGVSLALLFPFFNQPAVAGMAWGTLTGGALQLGVQLPSLKKTGFAFSLRLNLKDPGLRRILFLMLPATIGLSATQLNVFINTNFASGLAEGSVSWLNYAFRLVQLPIGVFGVALSIAAMPVIARQAARKDMVQMKRSFISALVMVFSLTIPASAGLILLAEPIIRLIFEHGVFSATDTAMTAQALQYYAVGLFAYSAIKVMAPVFYAVNKTRYPVLGSFLGVGLNLVMINLLIDHFHHRGIALATSCAIIGNFVFLGLALLRELDTLPCAYLAKGLAKIGLATGLMGLLVWWLTGIFAFWLTGSIFYQAAGIFSIIGAGGLFYIFTLYLLGLPELRVLAGKVTQVTRTS
ncbi:MAG: murein biosynthesis integral membrane protein MurJ [Desulfobulbus propionicus]|nr:MAG: murein biosynthesis integral membrane protein MurJ [Desulfobulbus propionicus]